MSLLKFLTVLALMIGAAGLVAGVPAAPANAQAAVTSAVAYINPDTGAATANPDVAANSSCATPDQADIQTTSPIGSTANNVHVDGCLFAGSARADAPASFQSSGVGSFSACPDPDGADAKTGVLSSDGLRCSQSGYQTSGTGSTEFHVRANSTVPGVQTVVFCSDADGDGCGDETAVSTVVITWVAVLATPTVTTTATAVATPTTGVATATPTRIATVTATATPTRIATATVPAAPTATIAGATPTGTVVVPGAPNTGSGAGDSASTGWALAGTIVLLALGGGGLAAVSSRRR
jgi:hypothetical protein